MDRVDYPPLKQIRAGWQEGDVDCLLLLALFLTSGRISVPGYTSQSEQRGERGMDHWKLRHAS